MNLYRIPTTARAFYLSPFDTPPYWCWLKAIPRAVFALALLLAVAAPARAQTSIIIGPASTLVWDMPGIGPQLAQGCTYQIAQGTGPLTAIVGPVTCSAAVPPATATSCSVNLVAQTVFTIGSGSVTMVATCSGTASLPSTPFAYVVIVVPIPTNLRIR